VVIGLLIGGSSHVAYGLNLSDDGQARACTRYGSEALSHQLRAAEDRIAELEAEVRIYQDRTERAEQWLHKIYSEVEERFIRRPEEKRRNAVGGFGGKATHAR
jgi:hypothetical protein